MLSIHCKIALFSLFPTLACLLKIRNREHVHYVGLVVAYTWNRKKKMFVALRKEFDRLSVALYTICVRHVKVLIVVPLCDIAS